MENIGQGNRIKNIPLMHSILKNGVKVSPAKQYTTNLISYLTEIIFHLVEKTQTAQQPINLPPEK